MQYFKAQFLGLHRPLESLEDLRQCVQSQKQTRVYSSQHNQALTEQDTITKQKKYTSKSLRRMEYDVGRERFVGVATPSEKASLAKHFTEYNFVLAAVHYSEIRVKYDLCT